MVSKWLSFETTSSSYPFIKVGKIDQLSLLNDFSKNPFRGAKNSDHLMWWALTRWHYHFMVKNLWNEWSHLKRKDPRTKSPTLCSMVGTSIKLRVIFEKGFWLGKVRVGYFRHFTRLPYIVKNCPQHVENGHFRQIVLSENFPHIIYFFPSNKNITLPENNGAHP